MSLLSSGSGVRTSPGRPQTMIIAIDCWRDQPKTLVHRVLTRVLGVTQFMYGHIQRLIQSDLIDLIVISSYDGRETSEFLYRHSKPYWEIWDTAELIELIQRESVTCVYYAGAAWDSCVRLRPVGYQQLWRESQRRGIPLEIRVQQQCVKDLQDQYFQPDQEPDWQAVQGLPGHWRYQPCG